MVSLASASDWLLLIIMLMSLLVEERYLSRPGIVANTISIFIATAHHWAVIAPAVAARDRAYALQKIPLKERILQKIPHLAI